jgi:hypothetical protein
MDIISDKYSDDKTVRNNISTDNDSLGGIFIQILPISLALVVALIVI